MALSLSGDLCKSRKTFNVVAVYDSGRCFIVEIYVNLRTRFRDTVGIKLPPKVHWQRSIIIGYCN